MKPLPDPYTIVPLTKPPDCTITVPGSKSITNRALILAALSDEKCILRGALWADDTQVMVDSLQKLGFDVTVEPDAAEECNRTITVVGRGGEIPAKKAELYVGNAGTAARFLTAFVCLGDGEYTICGDARMHERPMKDLFDALHSVGVQIKASDKRLPATVYAKRLRGGKIVINLTDSTQFASALVLIQKYARLELSHQNVEVQDPGYIEMTERMTMQSFRDYIIEPDMSSASYFFAAGFVRDGNVKVAGSSEDSLQIDGQFPRVLTKMRRARWRQLRNLYGLIAQTDPVSVSRLRDLGDSIMTLVICGLFSEKRLRIRPVNKPLSIKDAGRMRLQETDRIRAMVVELKRVGARVDEQVDGITVWPAELDQLHGADIETYNDHRMAMCFAVLGLKVPGIRIKNPSCVNKTFPNFFDKLEQLRT